MSLPLILAAKILNLNIYLLEPNLVLGRANKIFLKSCEKIFCYTDQIKKFPEIYKSKLITINPLVRKEYYSTKRKEISNKKFNLLIVGGRHSLLKCEINASNFSFKFFFDTLWSKNCFKSIS